MAREIYAHFIVDQLGPMTYQLSLLPEVKPVAWIEYGTAYVGDTVLEHLTDDEILELLSLSGRLQKLSQVN